MVDPTLIFIVGMALSLVLGVLWLIKQANKDAIAGGFDKNKKKK